MRVLVFSLIFCCACTFCVSCVSPNRTVSGSTATLTADSGRLTVEGGTLYYEVRGSGPPLVLLHAGGVDLTMWDPQVQPFARFFRIIRYDARGHGRSTAPTGSYSTVEDLRQLLDHLSVQQAHLVGISMGAGVAFGFATTYPQRVGKLALVSTSGPPPGVPVQPGALPPLTQEAGRVRLRALSIPRLLIVGKEDSPDHLAVAERVEAEVPQVQVVRIAGGKHIVNRDVPKTFNDVLLRFLQE